MYNEKLFEGSEISVGGAITLLMWFTLRHCLTKVALDDLLELLNILMPRSALPRTRFMFNKLFVLSRDKVERHFYCLNCTICTYIGQIINIDVCPVCNSNLKNESNVGFFLVLPLESQLRDMFENSNLSDLLQYSSDRTKLSSDNIEDIYDGSSYKSVPQLKEGNISITWNCDGANAFNSSSRSIWPLQCVINELPYNIRRKQILLTGLWFGSAKPAIQTFLKPFVDECRRLEKFGFMWMNKITKAMVNTKVFLLVCSCDSAARCIIQNIKQYNGKYGCSWCLNPGQAMANVNGGPPKRVFEAELFPSRTQAGFIADAWHVTQGGELQNGVKGANVLLLVKHFNIVDGFVVDYMHCILLGVVRQICTLWLEKAQDAWYVGNKIVILDKTLLSIKPPSTLTRTPRSLLQRAQWKASEWRNWLLFYSLFTLQGVLPSVYFAHYLLLVESVFILLSNSITPDELTYAEHQLHNFVGEFSVLYGLEHMSYNIHLLQHLATSVREWGPLWGTSNFMFESSNGFLLDLFNGTQGISVQICRTFALYRHLPILTARYLNGHSDNIENFLSKCISKRNKGKRAVGVEHGVTLFGAPKLRTLTDSQKQALEVVTKNVVPDRLVFHDRVIVNGQLIHGREHERTRRRINYCVSFSDGSYGLVNSFGLLDSHCYAFFTPLLLGRCVFNTDQATSRHIRSVVRTGDLSVREAHDIKLKCLYYAHSTTQGFHACVCSMPNSWELD
jgi:hypothetical protein